MENGPGLQGHLAEVLGALLDLGAASMHMEVHSVICFQKGLSGAHFLGGDQPFAETQVRCPAA